jgi:hypothetical protein
MAVYDPGDFGDRSRLSGVSEAASVCRECGWTAQSYKNAVANGARHTDATGHIVDCHQVINTTYGPVGAPVEALRLTAPASQLPATEGEN